MSQIRKTVLNYEILRIKSEIKKIQYVIIDLNLRVYQPLYRITWKTCYACTLGSDPNKSGWTKVTILLGIR